MVSETASAAPSSASGPARGPGRVRVLSDTLLLLSGIIWGTNFVVIKFALTVFTPYFFLATRFLLAAAVLAVLFRRRLRRATAREFGVSAAVGVVLYVGFLFQTEGVVRTSPGVVGFLTSFYVVLVPLMIGLWTRSWPRRPVALGVLLVAAGMTFLGFTGEVHVGSGEAFALAATVFWSFHILAVAHAAPRVDSFVLTCVQLGVAGILGLGTCLVFEAPLSAPDARGLGLIAYTAVLGGVLGYLFLAFGQKHTPPTIAGLLVAVEAVAALLLSVAVGYDSFSRHSVVGFALVLSGIVLAQSASRARVGVLAEDGASVPPEYAEDPFPVVADGVGPEPEVGMAQPAR